MSEPREIRDPIFGFIPLSGLEADLVNTPIFQRLRGIKQLAFANLLYPGALHTRFEHSLGTCHISGLLATSLKIEDERDLVRFAALLHDLGHGPFSHISEDALNLFSIREKLINQKGGQIHEKLTQDILKSDLDLNRFLGSAQCEKICSLLGEGYGDPLLKSIVSGPVDADKQDYLLRDSYFCGVKYGIFDISQLHRELRSGEDTLGGKELRISPQGVHALEQFILAKYYITRQVYAHRVRLITDQMLLRSIVLGIKEDHLDELQSIYSYDGSEEFIKQFIKWDDSRLLTIFTEEKYSGKYCYGLLNCLKQRKLLKLIYGGPISMLPEICRDPVSEISAPENIDQRLKLGKFLYDPICKTLKDKSCGQIDSEKKCSDLIIIHAYTNRSVRTQSGENDSSILVDTMPPVPFEEKSPLFQSIKERINEPFVEIYAPVYHDSPAQRSKLKHFLNEVIASQIEEFYKKEIQNENA